MHGRTPVLMSPAPFRPCLTPHALAALLAVVGLVNLGSALTPALPWRLELVQDLIGAPAVHLSQTATVLMGLCALMLARSLARRNRRAAHLALGALLASALLNLLKGLDVEEASICLGVAALLWRARRDFVVGALPISWRIAASQTAWLAGLSVLYAEAGALLLGRQVQVLATIGHSLHPLPFPLAAFLGLWSDAPTVRYAGVQGHWFQHSLHALATAVVIYAVVRLLRPLIPVPPASEDERGRARYLLERYGTDALSHFHLRHDRAYLFAPDGEGFVSYLVRGDVALLGGDPVCPPDAMRSLIRHALDTFAANGLTPCVVGASASAMHAYRREGMRALKIGEEAVIPLSTFDRAALAKRVRRAARAISAQGIAIAIGAMAELDPALTVQCPAVSRAWLGRHGGVEQGFSMTSGPLPGADDRDHRVALAAMPGADGGPGRLLGFLTLAPVPAARGWSLDHMRRLPEAPNGLMEALIIAAAERCRDEGYVMLSLNFAALSDKECPQGEGATLRAARAALFEGARHLPLRSLYRFNKKFNPRWSCRYWLYTSPDRLPAAAYATVRAEVSAPALLPGPIGAALRPH
jgi:lysylphosphatidylglycerol synthetase-like protein (DUF2156 family)